MSKVWLPSLLRLIRMMRATVPIPAHVFGGRMVAVGLGVEADAAVVVVRAGTLDDFHLLLVGDEEGDNHVWEHHVLSQW